VDSLIKLDSLSADPWFLQARLLEGLGQWDAAAESYRAARDRDQLRFRAPSEFNRVVRRVAAQFGATVVEVEAAFREDSPQGILGEELLTEHVHPELRGYSLLSHAFLAGLRTAEIPDSWSSAAPLAPPGPQPPLVNVLDSVLGDYRVQALRLGWPFRPRNERETFSPAPSSRVDTLALRLLRGETIWIRAIDELAGHWEEEGRLAEAHEAVQAMAAEFPVVPHFFLRAAELALQLGDLEASTRLLQESRRRGELPAADTLQARLDSLRSQGAPAH
jgi:hypothetical protein